MNFLKVAGVLGLACGLAGCLSAQSAPSKELIERGRYLVEEVGKCQECHSPRLESGEFDKEKWMKGAVLDFAPINPVAGWHKTSPDLTSSGRLFKRWGEQGLLSYLKTGVGASGKPADPPMPAYKLKPEDAEAVVAFLKSLP